MEIYGLGYSIRLFEEEKIPLFCWIPPGREGIGMADGGQDPNDVVYPGGDGFKMTGDIDRPEGRERTLGGLNMVIYFQDDDHSLD